MVATAHNRGPDRRHRVDRASARPATRLAWSMCALSLALTALGLLLLVLSTTRSDANIFDYWIETTAIAVSFSTVGAIIASRRPEHPIGWLFCTIGLLAAVDHFCGEYATYALLGQPDALPAGEAAAWVRSWVWSVTGGIGVFLLLLFPDGRMPGVRWRYLAWLNALVAVLGAIALAFSPGPIDGLGPIRNPLGVDLLGSALMGSAVNLVEVLQVAIALAAAVSPFVRLRHARFEKRQQIKWFAYAAAILIIGAGVMSLVPDVTDAWWVRSLGLVLYVVGIVGVPVTVGIAILRHHLFNIDLIINLTLVYGALTAALTFVYFGSAVLLQGTLRALTGEDSQLAVVASTLAIAALFSPLRRAIQSFIDRRFYRKKYDARKTLEAFSAKLRDETDLDALSDDLVGVVRETMQPAHASLWLRPDLGERAGSLRGRVGSGAERFFS
jgi:hypothetical protein